MEINGLPLHALAVHAAVVFGPLSALAGLAYAVPAWRNWVRIPLGVLVVVAVVAIWVAFLSGDSLLENNSFFQDPSVHPKVELHEHRAGVLRIIMTAYAVVALVAVALHNRVGALRYGLAALVVVGAIFTAIWTVLTGDAGAQIAWSGIKG